MSEGPPDFVYVIYIAVDQETVWNGLIDRELTKKYWGRTNESDWQPGSRWEHVRSDGSGVVDIHGEVLEIDPPRRLVVTWVFPNATDEEAKHTRVTYEIEPLGPDTRLTVIHSDLKEGSDEREGVTSGWPAVFSNLKTLLETGRTLSDEEWGA